MNFLHDVMFWRVAITVGFFLLFCLIVFWAYSAKRKFEFTEIKTAILSDPDDVCTGSTYASVNQAKMNRSQKESFKL